MTSLVCACASEMMESEMMAREEIAWKLRAFFLAEKAFGRVGATIVVRQNGTVQA